VGAQHENDIDKARVRKHVNQPGWEKRSRKILEQIVDCYVLEKE
jgi:hypothetical protein